MSARDKIQKTAPKLCFDSEGVTPEQLSELANTVDANFDALLDDLDPLPQPDNFDLEPFNFGDIQEDGPNGDGTIGGNDGGDDGQDGRDGGGGGGPAGCIVPAYSRTEIAGHTGTGPGLGIATLTGPVNGNGLSDEGAELVDNATLTIPPDPKQEADLEKLRNDIDPKLLNIGGQGENVIAYNISSQEVETGKNILLGTDAEGNYWVLVESCDES